MNAKEFIFDSKLILNFDHGVHHVMNDYESMLVMLIFISNHNMDGVVY